MARIALAAAIVAMVFPAITEAKEAPITQLQRTQQQLNNAQSHRLEALQQLTSSREELQQVTDERDRLRVLEQVAQ